MQPVAFEVSEGEALDQHIVWRVEAEHEAFFIPQKLWDTTPLDKLPISNGDMEMLHYRLSDGAIEPSPLLGLLLRRVPWLDRRVWLAEQRAKGVEPRACEQPRIEKPETRKLLMEAPRPLLELIENNVISFLGEIVAVVPGADPTGFPQEAVYIRVDEVLSDRQQQVRPGSILVRLRSRGSVVIQGQELCADRLPTMEATAVGDTVLIGGRPSVDGGGLLFPLFEFRVEEGQIQPGQATFATDALPKSLEQLWAEYNGDPLKGVLP